jgi:hypothetical protein
MSPLKKRSRSLAPVRRRVAYRAEQLGRAQCASVSSRLRRQCPTRDRDADCSHDSHDRGRGAVYARARAHENRRASPRTRRAIYHPSASRRYVTRLRAAMPRKAMHARRKWGGGGLRTDPSRLRARKRRLQQASRGERRRTPRARQQKSLSGFSYVYPWPRAQAMTRQRSLRMQTMPRSRVI